MIVVFGVILIITQAFQLLAAINAKKLKNRLQTIFVAGFNLIGVLCAGIQVSRFYFLKTCATNYIEAFRNVSYGDLTDRSHPVYAKIKDIDSRCGFRVLLEMDGTNVKDIATIVNDMNLRLSDFNQIIPLDIFLLIFVIIITAVSVKTTQGSVRECVWSVFKAQGANVESHRILKRFHLFLLLLKITNYLFACLLTLLVCGAPIARKPILGFGNTSASIAVIVPSFLVLSAINILSGYRSLNLNTLFWRSLFVTTILIYYSILVWLLFQSVQSDFQEDFSTLISWLMFFLTLTIISLVWLSVLCIQLARRFSYGLQDVIVKAGTKTSTNESYMRFSI